MSKEKDLLEKYVGDGITLKAAKTLIDGDKTPTKKYSERMIKFYIIRSRTNNSRAVKDIITAFEEFDSLLPYIEKKDVYNHNDYPNIETLKSVVECAKEIKEEKTFNRDDHVDVLIENDDYLLVHPFTQRGSEKYGKNTKWCTAGKNNNYFKSYSVHSLLFYLIRKKPKHNVWDKVAFQLNKNDVITGHINVYCASDNNKDTRSLMTSDWPLDTWVTITTLCRTFGVEELARIKAMKTVTNYIETCKKLDNVEEVQEAIRQLKAEPSKEIVHLMNEYKTLLKGFTDNIKNINKNGKYIETEN